MSSEGRMIYSQRLTVRIPCSVKSVKYPLDEETCLLNFSSFSQSPYISFKWAERPISVASIRLDEMTLGYSYHRVYYVMRLSQHSLVNWRLGPDADSDTRPDSHLHLKLRLTRQIGYYVLQVAQYQASTHLNLQTHLCRFTYRSTLWYPPPFSLSGWQRQNHDQKFRPESIFSVIALNYTSKTLQEGILHF